MLRIVKYQDLNPTMLDFRRRSETAIAQRSVKITNDSKVQAELLGYLDTLEHGLLGQVPPVGPIVLYLSFHRNPFLDE
jgi:hypothetical protein